MALWCLSLTVEPRSAAVVHHRHLLQLCAFADVRQQGAATFDLLPVQLGRGGVGLMRGGGHRQSLSDICDSSADPPHPVREQKKEDAHLTEGGGRRGSSWGGGRGRDGHPAADDT